MLIDFADSGYDWELWDQETVSVYTASAQEL